MKITKVLVVDSGPFIKSALRLEALASEFITVPEVLLELRDKASRDTLATLPYTLTTKTPSEEALKAIITFSKLTGDFASLSLTDIKVLALTLQLEWESVGRDHIRYSLKETAQPEKKVKKRRQQKKKSAVVPEADEVAAKQAVEVDLVIEEVAADLEEEDSDSDSGGEWITSDNVIQHKFKDTTGAIPMDKIPDDIQISCVTNDFAMQNVLLQMKLHLVSVDGMLINRLKTWVLRCHACFKTTTLFDKVFCPSCGNSTLLRTSVTVNANGVMKVYLKKNFQYRNRGTVYSIPAPKGGRKSSDLILREDQNEHKKALLVQKRLEKKAMNQDIGMEALLMFGQPGAKLNATGAPIIGYGRKNINEARGGVANVGVSNSGALNTGVANAGVANTGLLNSGVANAGVTNSGYGNQGVANSGVGLVGYGNSGYGIPGTGLFYGSGPLYGSGYGAGVGYSSGVGYGGVGYGGGGYGGVGYGGGYSGLSAYNSGYGNLGYLNSGYGNQGVANSGALNAGVANSGIANTGVDNSGIANAGVSNSGIANGI